MPDEAQLLARMSDLQKVEYNAETTSASELIKWANQILSIYRIILPNNSVQIQTQENILNEYMSAGSIFSGRAMGSFYTKCLGLMESTFEDFRTGFLKDLRVEMRAEVETDLLSQAKRFLDEGLKDPSAMIIGAILEDSLRLLCRKHGVPEGRNIESMNIPLTKAGVYNVTVQKQVTGWADIRNNADHARYEEYSIEQVKLMDQGVTDFIAKYLV